MSIPILSETVQSDHPPFQTTIRFDWRTAPLSANQRMSWQKRASVTKDVRTVSGWLARRIPRFNHVEVFLAWVVKDNRRRDADNVTPTLKAICDGLVDAGVVDDDTPRFMTKHMPQIHLDRTQVPHFELTVREVR